MNPEQNKATFAAIVIVAIFAVIGLIGTTDFGITSNVWYFTGFATQALGTADINITGGLSIKLSDMNISFGNGTVIAPSTYATLESNGSATLNGTWVAVNDPFVLENDGNALANVTIKAGVSAVSWFGGNPANAAMWYMYNDSESKSCLLDFNMTPLLFSNSTWLSLPVGPAVNGTCQKLNFTDTADTIRIDLKVMVPSDATPGLRENSITFTASQSL